MQRPPPPPGPADLRPAGLGGFSVGDAAAGRAHARGAEGGAAPVIYARGAPSSKTSVLFTLGGEINKTGCFAVFGFVGPGPGGPPLGGGPAGPRCSPSGVLRGRRWPWAWPPLGPPLGPWRPASGGGVVSRPERWLRGGQWGRRSRLWARRGRPAPARRDPAPCGAAPRRPGAEKGQGQGQTPQGPLGGLIFPMRNIWGVDRSKTLCYHEDVV